MLSEVFWVAFITTITGMIIKLSSMCYKSKCSKVTCCGVTIERDIAAEEKEEEFRLSHERKDSSP